MSYCVNCGVELGKSERVCPLCGTEVLNPKEPFDETAETPFPRRRSYSVPKLSRKTVLELITLIFAIPVALSVVCNIGITGHITWSGIAVGALIMLWLIIVSPIICGGLRRRSAPALMITVDFAALLCYLFYIEHLSGGNWFMSFAFPLCATLLLIILFIFMTGTYSRLSGLILTAVSVMFAGVFCVVTDALINSAFSVRDHLSWSLYPMTTAVIIGIIFIFIDRKPALKEKIKKKFFI